MASIAPSSSCQESTKPLVPSDCSRSASAGRLTPALACAASTGVKDKNAPDTLYIAGLAAPNTVNTMPEATLLAFADHGAAPAALPRDGGESEATLSAHAKAGVDLAALAERLQSDGAKGFVDSWRELLGAIDAKSKTLV